MKRFVIGTFFISALAVGFSPHNRRHALHPPHPSAPVAPASVSASPPIASIACIKACRASSIARKSRGIVTLVAREGKIVDLHAVGLQDVEKNVPMKTDAIFRIASMTKPVTSVAIMMLFEEGKLFLTDPVSKFIPAFKSATVMEGAGAEAKPVAARRAITIRDLLSHRVGDHLRIPQWRRGWRRLSQERRHRWTDVDDDDAGGGDRQAGR